MPTPTMASTGAVLLEARPFRPFKSSEEYLYAMKEDLAEWLTVLYPELRITADNFLDRLDTGVALCRHANAVRESAAALLGAGAATGEPEEARALAKTLRARGPVPLLPAARPQTFFARDNLSNFIEWCRRALGVLECLLFETDDLCLRKNEKHVVLCLLEVARRGSLLGMPAPMLVQMERQIERELAGEETEPGPLHQLVTNDLRGLHERVRDLVERCTCPTQFPMVRVSEGKYRIGDTKLLIFVRILRSHVMVRVGGGWDTLEHYLDKHDPCRCRAQHRATLGARLVAPRAAPYAALSGAAVHYDRGAPAQPASLPCMNVFTKNDTSSPSRDGLAPAALHVARPAVGAGDGTGGPGAGRAPAPRRVVVSSPHLVPAPHAARALTPPAAESDNGSELSDEGYRSLGLQPSPAHAPKPHRYSLHSQTSVEDAEYSERLDADDGCQSEKTSERVDEYVSLSTGLRKTDFSDTFYGGKKQEEGGAKSARPSPERPARPDTNDSPSASLRARQASRIPHSPQRARTPTRAPAARASPAKLPPPARNTWSGRAAPGASRAKSRPALGADTFESPKQSPKQSPKESPKASPKKRAPATRSPPSDSFRRNSPLRATCAGSRSPPGSKPLSPLLEQILRSAESAHDDAAALEKIKDIIRTYSNGRSGSERDDLSRGSSKDSDYADFTSAWVMSDGKLERSTSTRQLAAPRKDPRGGASRIPAPLACRRSTSTANFE